MKEKYESPEVRFIPFSSEEEAARLRALLVSGDEAALQEQMLILKQKLQNDSSENAKHY